MRFWDSSAVVCLLVRQAASGRMEQLFKEDATIVVWSFTYIECVSALRRLQRMKVLDLNNYRLALSRLDQLKGIWTEVEPSDHVKRLAVRILGRHSLSAADSLQLAAALILVSDEPKDFLFVCLDTALSNAAEGEGFFILA